MTNSIPASASNPAASLNPGGSTASASLLGTLSAAGAGSAGSPPAIPGQPGPDFATWLGAPAQANVPAGAAANLTTASTPVGSGQGETALNSEAFPAACCGVSMGIRTLPGAALLGGLCKPRVLCRTAAPELAPGSSAGDRAAFNSTAAVELTASFVSATIPPAVFGQGKSAPVTVIALKTAATLSATDKSGQPVQTAVSRDAVETAAALLAPVLQSLQPLVLAQGGAAATQPAAGPKILSSSKIAVSPVPAKIDSPPASASAPTEAPDASHSIPAKLAAAKLSAHPSVATGPALDEPGVAGHASSEAAATDPLAAGSRQVADAVSPKLATAAPAPLQAVIDFGAGSPAVTVTLSDLAPTPGRTLPTAAATQQTIETLIARALEKSGVQLAQPAPAAGQPVAARPPSSAGQIAADGLPAVSVLINLPSPSGSAQVARPSVSQPITASPVETVAVDGMANIADTVRTTSAVAQSGKAATEKNFLVAQNDEVRIPQASTGISVAKTSANMSANFTARRNAASLPDPVLPIFVRETAMPVGTIEHAPVPAASTSTPPPLLAHRAVETVLNVVDIQNNRPAAAGVVNLHFKFGGEDLAVRVQLRGGEVHTQFNTDSTELRTALSNEWRAASGQGSPGGLRLVEPVFGSSGSGSDHSFGSAPQGQSSSQQHPQPQSAPTLLPGLRALRQGANAPAEDVVTSLPRQPVALPTSLHLAAVA